MYNTIICNLLKFLVWNTSTYYIFRPGLHLSDTEFRRFFLCIFVVRIWSGAIHFEWPALCSKYAPKELMHPILSLSQMHFLLRQSWQNFTTFEVPLRNNGTSTASCVLGQLQNAQVRTVPVRCDMNKASRQNASATVCVLAVMAK